MMARKYVPLLALLIVCSCSDTVVEDFSLNGSLNGNVNLRDQFSYLDKEDPSGTRIVLTDSLHEFIAYADRQGNFHIDEIPTGVYTISLEKEGFTSTYGFTSLSVIGGNAPLYRGFTMHRPSTAYITDFSLAYISDIATAKGIIHHNWKGSDPFYWPGIPLVFFASTSPAVSPQNYEAVQFQFFLSVNSLEFASTMLENFKSKFAPGTTVYMVGYCYSGQVVYDFRAGRYQIPGIGSIASGVKSITLK